MSFQFVVRISLSLSLPLSLSTLLTVQAVGEQGKAVIFRINKSRLEAILSQTFSTSQPAPLFLLFELKITDQQRIMNLSSGGMLGIVQLQVNIPSHSYRSESDCLLVNKLAISN